ncbi:MAG: hypothetical protein K5798_08935 [Nitrosopumilus sp.]|nr:MULTISPECIES: hypothetical protein [Nitrosopumilus]MCV0367367.1 hypothetical protein [Nitrosopumilus sp.]
MRLPNQFFVHGDDEFVDIWSDPFEPKERLMEFRTEIQNKIAQTPI